MAKKYICAGKKREILFWHRILMVSGRKNIDEL
jgi:hypothetical protein